MTESETSVPSSNPSSNPTQDPVSPYYIHPNGNASIPLISKKFNGEGYGEWKRSMMIALSVKNKLGFINGTLPKPSISDPKYKAWERCNDIIISYVLRSVEAPIAKSVIYLNTAAEIWKDLEERFSQTSGPEFITLQQNLSEISQESALIAEYFTQIKAIWDELSGIRPLLVCTCNGCKCNLTQEFVNSRRRIG